MEEEHFPPPSPGASPVMLADCIEELLKLIFLYSIEETLEINLGLSKDYCSNLLKDDPGRCNLDDLDNSGGVPLYPLYKSLASALVHCITSGGFLRTSYTMMPIQEDESLEQKRDSWNKLVLEKGSELVKRLEAVEFELHIQEPFFSQLRVGTKTIEGRCAVGDYNRIRPGGLLLFNKFLLCEVQNVKRYASFSEMLEAESLEKVLPGVKTFEEGVQIYRKFYTEVKEKSNGVLAIYVSKPNPQPYISLAGIVSGLGYEGIGSFLGLMHTAGTVPDALPPPRSTLLTSFMLPHKINGTLTEGARALAKHINRVSNGWWGSFSGNDSNKNSLALRVIGNLITNCCWINVHIVPPYEGVLEIRVAEGYGARWSKDGSQFIGFLEPYMEDGHSKGWKH